MPGKDRTGPQGMGPMTGWGAGYCGGQRGTGDFGSRGWQCGTGRGLQRGGGGRGRRNQYYATGQPGWRRSGWDFTPTPEQEALALKNEAAALEDELKLVKQRLAAVEKTENPEE